MGRNAKLLKRIERFIAEIEAEAGDDHDEAWRLLSVTATAIHNYLDRAYEIEDRLDAAGGKR